MIDLDYRKLGISSATYAISDIVTRGVSFLLIPIYTRYLSPTDYGNWGVLLSIISFLNILLSLQLGSALTINYFQIAETQQKNYISTIWILIIISATFISTLLILGKDLIVNTFHGFQNTDLVIGIGISYFATFAIVPQTLMRLRYQVIKLVTINLTMYLIGSAVGLVLVVTGKLAVTGILIGMLVANIIAVIPFIFGTKKDLTFSFSRHVAIQSLMVSLPILPHMLSHWGLNLMDRVILKLYLPSSDVGIYQLGYQLGASFQVIVIAFNNAWTPFFLKSFLQPANLQKLKSLATLFIFIQLWAALFLVFFLPLTVKIVFPEEYWDAISVIPWIVLGFVFVVFYQYWINVLFYYKKTVFISVATGISALVNLILNLIIIPQIGYLGAAINTAIGYAVLATLAYFWARKISDFSFEYKRWIKICLIGLTVYSLGTGINIHSTYHSIILRSVLFFSFPVVLYFFSFWQRNELVSVFTWLKQIIIRNRI